MVLPHRVRLGVPGRILDRSRLADGLSIGTTNRAFEDARAIKENNMGRSTSRNLANRRRKQKIKKQLSRQSRQQKKAKK